MGKRVYVNPELAVVEMTSSAMLSVSLGVSDEEANTSGRSRELNRHDSANSSSVWDQEW